MPSNVLLRCRVFILLVILYFLLFVVQILVHQPGVESMPPALRVHSPNNRTAREVPK